MKVDAEFQFLGTGNSLGVPMIGCQCPVCSSDNPKNQRLRPSAVLKVGERVFLVDAGQDYRTQALRHKINHIDGVLFTHAHHDHVAGLDDLRIYILMDQEPLPCLLSEATEADLRMRYSYMFRETKIHGQLTTKLALQVLPEERGSTTFEGLEVGYMSYEQARMPVNGFRFGNLAYVSDICKYPETIFEDLRGVEVLVLSALRHEKTPIHFTVDEAVAFAEKVGAKQTWLTHISHDLEHEETNAYLPANVRMAYDGLQLKCTVERRERI